jgi:hypothetical protein
VGIFEHRNDDGSVVGGDIDKVSVSVVASGDELDPTMLTRLFGLEPTFAARKGDIRPSRSGTKTVVQRTGVWYVDVADSREWLLEDAIEALLAKFPSDLTVWARAAESCELALFCALHIEDWNRGCELSPAALRQIAERGLSLDLDIYYSGEDPENDA